MIDKDILKLLSPLKRKYYMTKIVNYFIHGIHCFFIALLSMIVLSKIVSIPYIMNKSIKLFILLMMLTIIFSIYKKPKDIELAKVIDSFGLKERVVTSLENSEDDTVFSSIQKKDTIKHLKDDNLKKNIKIKYPKKTIVSTVVIIFITIIMINISTPSVNRAKDIERDKQIIEKENEDIEKVINEIKEDKELTQTQKKEIENKLRELKKTLDKSKKLEDLDKDILKTKKELEKLREKLKNEEIERLTKELEKIDLTKQLSKEVLNKNKENISKEMKNIEDKLKNMDKKDLQKSIEDLEKIEKSIEDEEIKEAINSLANSLNQNIDNLQNSNIESDLANLSNSLSDSLSSGSCSSKSVCNGISKLEGMVSTGQMSGQASQNGSTQVGGNGTGGTGSGSGTAQGQGQGQGSGSGAGSGSSNESGNGGSNGGLGGNSSKTQNDGGVKDYEKIHAPKNQSGEGYDTQVSGSKGEQGDVDSTQVKKFGDKVGEEVPYNEVLKNYKKSAYEKINTEDIPPKMKDVVKKYFIELE
ncbi:hypothetical protein TICRE_06980 [Tissierella creatinophila DSM 6911]|uniref:Uncharacterized protein n=2 Tax=Tissierella creatinophila TaxID=79681 RepID=A0A1U7M7N9_TISCR|nr:hypothetical protein TICRE_06980 [Tissierella creatinophila DSM 6911]